MKTFLIALSGCALLFAGCNSVDNRIAENPDLYYSLSLEDQVNVKAGAIDTGFSQDMVWLALGRPDQTGRILRDGQEVEIWRYVDYRAVPVRTFGFYSSFGHRRFYHPWYGASFYHGYGPFYSHIDFDYIPVDRVIIEFVDGRATTVYYPNEEDFRPPIGREGPVESVAPGERPLSDETRL